MPHSYPTRSVFENLPTIDESFKENALDPNPSWFDEGFVNNSWSRLREPWESPFKFLIAGRRPQVGMRTEINIYATDDSWFRLSGLVSEIEPMPSDIDLDESNSSNWHVDTHDQICVNPENCPFHKGSEADKKRAMIEQYGAYHGQRIKSLAILNHDFYDHFDRPVAEDQVVELTLVCDDNMKHIWQVECVKVIYDLDTLPTYFLHFRDWFGKDKPCQCHECRSTLKEVCYGNGCNCTECRVGESPARPKIVRPSTRRMAVANSSMGKMKVHEVLLTS
jgi:hypothetical protein